MLHSLLNDLLPCHLLHLVLAMFSIQDAGTDCEQGDDTNGRCGVYSGLLCHVDSVCVYLSVDSDAGSIVCAPRLLHGGGD